MFDNSFLACALFFLSFFLVEISSHTLIPLYRPGSVHSGSASWDDYEQVFPDDLRVSLFPDSFPHYTWTSSRVSPLVGSKVYSCLCVTCHLHFWQIGCGLLRATAVTWGWNGHRIKRQHTKLTLEKEILPPLLPGFELTTFRSRVRHSNQQATTCTSPKTALRTNALCLILHG